MLTTTLLLATLSVLQDPPAGAPRAQDPAPPYDFVVGVAGNEVVLRTDLDIIILQDSDLRERFQRSTTALEQNEVQFDALSTRLEELIMVQAGSNLGFDQALVSQLTDHEFKQQVERAGGSRAMSQSLAQSSISPDRYRQQIRDRLLMESWRRSQLGRAQGPTGRISVDRYIRPGLMRMYYDSFIDSPVRAEREAIGQLEAKVRVQVLQVNVVAGASKEQTLAKIEALVDAFEAGDATFELLIGQYGDRTAGNQRGTETPVSIISRLGELRHGGLDLARLASEGAVGDITQPLWLETRSPDGLPQTQAWCVYRLAEQISAVPPQPFESPGLQPQLKTYLLKVLDKQRESMAFRKALGDTHVWPDQYRAVILESRSKKRGL